MSRDIKDLDNVRLFRDDRMDGIKEFYIEHVRESLRAQAAKRMLNEGLETDIARANLSKLELKVSVKDRAGDHHILLFQLCDPDGSQRVWAGMQRILYLGKPDVRRN